eukprot:SAG11_NODE_7717_length_1105_cov_1.334990_2_plen_97_part_00
MIFRQINLDLNLASYCRILVLNVPGTCLAVPVLNLPVVSYFEYELLACTDSAIEFRKGYTWWTIRTSRTSDLQVKATAVTTSTTSSTCVDPVDSRY